MSLAESYHDVRRLKLEIFRQQKTSLTKLDRNMFHNLYQVVQNVKTSVYLYCSLAVPSSLKTLQTVHITLQYLIRQLVSEFFWI